MCGGEDQGQRVSYKKLEIILWSSCAARVEIKCAKKIKLACIDYTLMLKSFKRQQVFLIFNLNNNNNKKKLKSKCQVNWCASLLGAHVGLF